MVAIEIVHTYCDLVKDGVADTGFNMFDLLNCRGFIKTPDEQINIARWRKLFMIVLASRRQSAEPNE